MSETTRVQAPIGSGFSAASTAAEVVDGIDLTGRTAIVTGGYSGIGIETVRALADAGATVIIPNRDEARARAALEGIPDLEFDEMSLLEPASIDAFAQRFLASGRPLHLLVNSAGIMGGPLVRDDRGYEAQFATNHLGHFQLNVRLWPALVQAGGARIVAVSSWGHRYTSISFDDPHFERREYVPLEGYGQSKTGNVLFALEADRRGRAEGIRAFSLHPGSIFTPLARHIPVENLKAAGVLDEDGNPIYDITKARKTPEQGASTSVWCATSPKLDGLGGLYCQDTDVAPLVEIADVNDPEAMGRLGADALGVMPHAVDPDTAVRLWEFSEELTGVSL